MAVNDQRQGSASSSSSKFGSSALRVWKRLYSASFIRGVAVIAGGSAVAQAIPIVLTPILTRLYNPTDMGMLGLYAAFISFAANATTLGYSQAIVSGKSDAEAADLTSVSALIVVPMSLVGALLLYFLSRQELLGFGELPLWTSAAMALSLVLTGLFFTFRYWLVRTGAYQVISVSTVSQSMGRMGTQIISGIAGLGWVGLMLGEIVGRAFGLGRMWTASRNDLDQARAFRSQARLTSVAKDYRKFPLLTAPSSMLNSLSLVLPVPLITMYFGIHAAGQYAVASRIMILPLSLIGASVGDVFHGQIARLSREDPHRAVPLFLRVALGLLALGLGPMLIIRLFGSSIFGLVLGNEWSVAGGIAAAITPWMLMQLAVSPVSRLVQVYQGQEFKLLYDVLALCSIGGILTYGHHEGWSIVRTCAYLGWSQALVYGIYLLLLARIIMKYRMINHESLERPFDAT